VTHNFPQPSFRGFLRKKGVARRGRRRRRRRTAGRIPGKWVDFDYQAGVSTKDFCLKKSIFFQYALDDGSATDITAPAQQAGFDCYSYDYIGYQQSATPAP
jgi:hypothetical protein